MNLRKQRKDLVTGHHNPQPHKWNKESMGLWRCAVAVLVRYEAIIGELLRRASYEAEAEAARSAEASAAAAASAAAVAVAVAEEDSLLIGLKRIEEDEPAEAKERPCYWTS